MTRSVLADELLYPVDVTVDDKGAIFVADHEAHALLKLDGKAFRVVAKGKGLPRTPLYGIRHIAADKEGRIVATDPATMKLYRIDASGNVTPVPDDERWVTPWGIVVEPGGSLLAVDRVNDRLRRVSADGRVTEVATVKAPRAVLLDGKGGVLVVADRNVHRVDANGKVSALLEKPPFELLHDGVLHPNGNLYVSDGYARAIWQITPDGKVTALVKGPPLESPQGMAMDGGKNLLVADARAKTLFVVTTKGEITPLIP